jgi:hypothetical protein
MERAEQAQKQPQILVGVASYRDDELLNTITDALAKAKHPSRVILAVINQYDPGLSHLLDYFRQDNLKLVSVDYRKSAGVGWARRLMTDLYTNEDFCLQIDAHSRFEQGWDEALLLEWQACKDPKAVLSAYPTAFEYDKQGQVVFTPYPKVGAMSVDKFNQNIPIFKGSMHGDPAPTRRPILGTSAGFIFGPGAVFEVPYVREVCFMGEEFVRAFQLYSHGFNLYAPNVLPVHHLYFRKNSRFWQDMPKDGDQERYNAMTKKSYAFIRQLLEGKLPNYAEYFGAVRSLEDYEKYLGTEIRLTATESRP